MFSTVHQEVDDDAVRLWESLLDQQFSLAIYMHFQNFFLTPDPLPPPSTFPPIITEENVDTYPFSVYDTS